MASLVYYTSEFIAREIHRNHQTYESKIINKAANYMRSFGIWNTMHHLDLLVYLQFPLAEELRHSLITSWILFFIS
ncbi:hypothetical protein PanWU01x14_099890 [Parasponia andersonii]|uniref:Uncharacterized protein n=1 Tax=Parasponia andersonii TaxID=3476 RepID=A0A2P5D3F9_PARAD|nr:hypothetical protein PanWU01x14_099890 [Parasponia andersonii]